MVVATAVIAAPTIVRGACASETSDGKEEGVSKKIIEVGQDIPSPDYVNANIRAMEKRPFDGVTMRLPNDVGAGRIFDVKAWDATDDGRAKKQQREMATLSSISWGERFTDNFVLLYARSTMDWFSDDDWAKVLENVRFCARAA